MISLGTYERLTLEVLRGASKGPWHAVDVERLAESSDDPAGHKGVECWHEVRDWLRSLSHVDRLELVERLNQNRARR